MQKILIVIDMQNDFVTGSLGSEAAQVAAKNIAAHINEYDTVIFTRDTHGPDYLDTLEGKFLPVPHCIKDTEGWEIIPELVVFSASQEERYPYIADYLIQNNIPFDAINEDVLTEKRKPTRKLYYNILLDDRAGLGSAYTALDMLYSKLEAEGELKTWRT